MKPNVSITERLIGSIQFVSGKAKIQGKATTAKSAPTCAISELM
jgi:hypothetical protein